MGRVHVLVGPLPAPHLLGPLGSSGKGGVLTSWMQGGWSGGGFSSQNQPGHCGTLHREG